MAGYGIRSFLIAQSLNQIEKAYGPNNAILDNCHVRVSFAANDERTAKRVSDALGTATEIRDAKNYAGHRLSPWLGHLMISRQETARPLLTPGEIMQLPPADELVLVSGLAPIRAKKARYYADRRLASRVLPPSERAPAVEGAGERRLPADDWTSLPPPIVLRPAKGAVSADDEDDANSGIRREPELPDHEAITPYAAARTREFDEPEEKPDQEAVRAQELQRRFGGLARQAALDPGDGMEV